MEVPLQNRYTERFITHINPDITSAIKTAKRDVKIRMMRQSPLRCQHRLLKTLPCQSRFLRNKAYISTATTKGSGEGDTNSPRFPYNLDFETHMFGTLAKVPFCNVEKELNFRAFPSLHFIETPYPLIDPDEFICRSIIAE